MSRVGVLLQTAVNFLLRFGRTKSSPMSLRGNLSSANPIPPVREPFTTALVKNVVVVVVWLVLTFINGTLIATFFRHQTFYEDPRYILFIHMVINDATMLTLTVLLFVLSYTVYKINVSFCSFLILMAVFTTRNTPINLASMAIERYIAVCKPLRYSQICTVRRTYVVIGFIWLLSVAPDVVDLFIILAMEPLSYFYDSVFCLRSSVFKLPILDKKKLAFDIIYFSSVFLVLLFTYLKVLTAARALSSDVSAQKARNTILLHGLQLAMCMLSYITPIIQVLLRFIVPGYVLKLQFSTYLIVYILPRFLSPVIYGIRDQKLRKYLKMYLQVNRSWREAKKVQPEAQGNKMR